MNIVTLPLRAKDGEIVAIESNEPLTVVAAEQMIVFPRGAKGTALAVRHPKECLCEPCLAAYRQAVVAGRAFE